MIMRTEMSGTEQQDIRARHGNWHPDEEMQDQMPTGISSSTPVQPRDKEVLPEAGYTGPTYYQMSPVKASKYEGLVWSYTYIAGLAGCAQILATIADLTRSPVWAGMVRNGRYLAMLAPAVGSVLLIADLHTPSRWYNMLRIYRSTSPMSIGTYLLSGFGAASGIVAAGQMLGNMQGLQWLKPAAKAAQVPAAITGAGMSTYTAALISSTSTPLWASAPRLIGARFACSSVATAAAALSLGETLRGADHNSDKLDQLAAAATLADAALSLAADREYEKEGVAGSLRDERTIAAEHRLSKVLEHALPLACYGLKRVLPQHARTFSMVAAFGVLAGGMLMRSSLFHAGNQSAKRPQDAFAFTQGDEGSSPVEDEHGRRA